jgi:multiple sugar transport system ATP-binding protein
VNVFHCQLQRLHHLPFCKPLNLDASLRGQIRSELARLHEDLDAMMVCVTHDQVEAMTLADIIVVLQAGRVEQVGLPLGLYHHPANLFVAGFIGSPRINFFEALVIEADGGGVTVEAVGARLTVPAVAAAARAGADVTLGIRPEALRADPAGPLAGEVWLAEQLGGLTLLHVALAGGEPEVVQIEGSNQTPAHAPIRLAVDGTASHAFDVAGQVLLALGRHPLTA